VTILEDRGGFLVPLVDVELGNLATGEAGGAKEVPPQGGGVGTETDLGEKLIVSA